MDSTFRTISKAFTWQMMGIISMTALGYYFTGSLTNSVSLAVSGALTGFITYLIHERVWNIIKWGRT